MKFKKNLQINIINCWTNYFKMAYPKRFCGYSKINKEARMKENIEVFDFALSEEEMIKIKTLDIEKEKIVNIV